MAFIEAPRRSIYDAHAIEILGEDQTLYPTREADMAWIVTVHEVFPALLTAAREAYRSGAVINKAMEHRMIDLERENENLREEVHSLEERLYP